MISEEDKIWEIKNIITDNVYSEMNDHYDVGPVGGIYEAAKDILEYIKEHYVEKKM